MTAIMAVIPVHLTHHGHGLHLVGGLVGVHVAGMFCPSPLSGWLADHVGGDRVRGAGLALLMLTALGWAAAELAKEAGAGVGAPLAGVVVTVVGFPGLCLLLGLVCAVALVAHRNVKPARSDIGDRRPDSRLVLGPVNERLAYAPRNRPE